jgi:hypothetical protein
MMDISSTKSHSPEAAHGETRPAGRGTASEQYQLTGDCLVDAGQAVLAPVPPKGILCKAALQEVLVTRFR